MDQREVPHPQVKARRNAPRRGDQIVLVDELREGRE
jgi:hypothetical protein